MVDGETDRSPQPPRRAGRFPVLRGMVMERVGRRLPGPVWAILATVLLTLMLMMPYLGIRPDLPIPDFGLPPTQSAVLEFLAIVVVVAAGGCLTWSLLWKFTSLRYSSLRVRTDRQGTAGYAVRRGLLATAVWSVVALIGSLREALPMGGILGLVGSMLGFFLLQAVIGGLLWRIPAPPLAPSQTWLSQVEVDRIRQHLVGQHEIQSEVSPPEAANGDSPGVTTDPGPEDTS